MATHATSAQQRPDSPHRPALVRVAAAAALVGILVAALLTLGILPAAALALMGAIYAVKSG